MSMTPQAREERRQKIVNTPSALGREDLAAHLADHTELTPLQATAVLQKAGTRKLSLAERARAMFKTSAGG